MTQKQRNDRLRKIRIKLDHCAKISKEISLETDPESRASLTEQYRDCMSEVDHELFMVKKVPPKLTIDDLFDSFNLNQQSAISWRKETNEKK